MLISVGDFVKCICSNPRLGRFDFHFVKQKKVNTFIAINKSSWESNEIKYKEYLFNNPDEYIECEVSIKSVVEIIKTNNTE